MYYGPFLVMNADVNHAVEARTSQWLCGQMKRYIWWVALCLKFAIIQTT